MYDLINVASETAMHKAPVAESGRLQAFVGTLVSEEFDLDGAAEKVPECTGLFAHLN